MLQLHSLLSEQIKNNHYDWKKRMKITQKNVIKHLK